MQILSNQNCAHVNCTDVPTEHSSTLRYLLPFGNQHSLASAVAEYGSACRLKDRCRCCGKSESCSSCQLQCETNPIHIGKQLDPADRWQDMILTYICLSQSLTSDNLWSGPAQLSLRPRIYCPIITVKSSFRQDTQGNTVAATNMCWGYVHVNRRRYEDAATTTHLFSVDTHT